MKNIDKLVREICASTISPEDIEEIRKLISQDKSSVEIRETLINRMAENSREIKEYLEEELLLAIMSIMAGKIHWSLIYWMTQIRLQAKKDLFGWSNLREGKMISARSQKLKGKFLSELGKFKWGSGTKEADEAIAILEKAAQEILDEVQEE